MSRPMTDLDLTACPHLAPEGEREELLAFLTDEGVEHCLTVLALHSGNAAKASARLRNTGYPHIKAKHLKEWREWFPEMYEEAVETQAPRTAKAQALELEELAAKEGKVTLKLLKSIEQDIPNMSGKDAAIVLSHLEKAKATNIDKARTARNLPTKITQERTVAELIEHLAKKYGPEGAGVIDLPSELVEG